MGVRLDPGDIAARPDPPLSAHPTALVDLQAALARRDAEPIEAEVGDARLAPDGEQESLGLQGRAILQGQLDAAIPRAGAARLRVEAQIDPVIAQCVREDGRDRRLLARQELRARLHQGDARAERGVDLGQFAADRATAEHEQRRRALRGGERLIAGPGGDIRQAVDRRGGGRRAGRDHQVAVAEFARPDADHARSEDDPAPAHQGDAMFPELPRAESVVGWHDRLPPPDGASVGGVAVARFERLGDRAETLRLAQEQADLGRVQQHLARHAGDEAALAADPVSLDDRDRLAAVRELVRQVLAGTPGPEDHDVELVHLASPRIAAMAV